MKLSLIFPVLFHQRFQSKHGIGSFLVYHFLKVLLHFFNIASEFTITLPFSSFITLMCCISFPALSLCLANLYNSFSPSVVTLACTLNQIESPIICLFLLTSHVVRYNKRISIKVLNFPHLRLR